MTPIDDNTQFKRTPDDEIRLELVLSMKAHVLSLYLRQVAMWLSH